MAAAGRILDAQVMSSGIFLGSRVLLPSSGTRSTLGATSRPASRPRAAGASITDADALHPAPIPIRKPATAASDHARRAPEWPPASGAER